MSGAAGWESVSGHEDLLKDQTSSKVSPREISLCHQSPGAVLEASARYW